MDFSKLKVDVYEFLGLIVPGLVAFAELGISVVGWTALLADVNSLSGVTLTLIVILAFAAGHVIQELSDTILKRVKGPRFFKISRDELWKMNEGEAVRVRILRESGLQLSSVDSAFEYCLARVQANFPKRDVFLATSDLCRALVLLFAFALLPLWRTIYVFNPNYVHKHTLFGAFAVLFGIFGWMSWKRMVRFREFTEAAVFRSYLATAEATPQETASGPSTRRGGVAASAS